MATQLRETVIVGSGPAGLTAALYLARAELKPLVIAGKTPGGQLMLTDIVENYPGFPEGVTGPDLIARMTKQAEQFGAEFIYENATSLAVDEKPFLVRTQTGSEHRTKSVILAMGAKTRWLGIPDEKELIGKGISSCAVCDAPLFKDKVTFVVGGGDSAMEEALALKKFTKSVTIIHRRAELRASRIMAERVKKAKIPIRWNSIVTRVVGAERLESIIVKDLKTDEESALPAEGLFIAIGHDPETEFIQGTIELDRRGYVELRRGVETSVPGIFVAGDVHDPSYKQAVTAAGFGCMAALEAERWLASQG